MADPIVDCRAVFRLQRALTREALRAPSPCMNARCRGSCGLKNPRGMRENMDLSQSSDGDLLSSVAKLAGSHRELTARLVAHLAEIEDRRLHLLAGFSSMFDFCQQKLGLSEGEAFRRILAARLARRFPVVYSLLASGRTNLTTLELLREHLTEGNHAELFAAVAGKGKLEVQTILAVLFPRPDRASRIRRVASIEPLSEARFKVEFTASDALREKLELCRDLMSHANPSRDLAVVVERAVDLLLADLEKRRFGRTGRSRRAPRKRDHAVHEPGRRHAGAIARPSDGSPSLKRKSPSIAIATRSAVFERDGLHCTYVGEGGRRCQARAFLELDHIEAKALGGAHDVSNLRVLCRAHNQLRAEQTFGREHIEQKRHLRQKKSTTALSAPEGMPTTRTMWSGSGMTPETTAIYEKVRSALRGLGFRDAQARRAVAAVARRHDSSEEPPLEQVLREAIHVAAAA